MASTSPLRGSSATSAASTPVSRRRLRRFRTASWAARWSPASSVVYTAAPRAGRWAGPGGGAGAGVGAKDEVLDPPSIHGERRVRAGGDPGAAGPIGRGLGDAALLEHQLKGPRATGPRQRPGAGGG